VARSYGGSATSPMAATPSRTASLAARNDGTTRQVIIDAALRAFAMHGFDATTNKMIARGAGVAPGLLYHYFESKEALFAAVYSDITHYRFERSRAVLRSELTFSGKIEALARDLVEMWNENSPYVEFHARTLYERNQGRLTLALKQAREETEQQWRSIVEEAKARGDLSSTMSTAAAADMCVTWSTGLVMLLPVLGAERTLASTSIFIAAIESLSGRSS
jgi:AcrR family transcriptional regulator